MSRFLAIYESDHIFDDGYVPVTEGVIETIKNGVKKAFAAILKACKAIKDAIARIIKTIYDKLRKKFSGIKGTVQGKVTLFEGYFPLTESEEPLFLFNMRGVSDGQSGGRVNSNLDSFYDCLKHEDLGAANKYLDDADGCADEIEQHLTSNDNFKTYEFTITSVSDINTLLATQDKKLDEIKRVIDTIEKSISDYEKSGKFKLCFNSVNDLMYNETREQKLALIKRANAIHIRYLNILLAYAKEQLNRQQKNAEILFRFQLDRY